MTTSRSLFSVKPSASFWWILLAAFAFRLLTALLYVVVQDEMPQYYRAAESLWAGEGMRDLMGQPLVSHAPVLAWLAALVNFALPTWATSDIVFAGFGTLMTAAVGWLALELYGERAAGYAMALVSVLPVLNAVVLSSDTHLLLLGFLLAQAAVSYLLVRDPPTWPRCAAWGFLGALAYLSRPEAIVHSALWAVLIFWWNAPRFRENFPLRLSQALCGLVCFLALSLPYWLWLHEHMGRWSLSGGAFPTYVLDRNAVPDGVSWAKARELYGDEAFEQRSVLQAMHHNPGMVVKKLRGGTKVFFQYLGSLKGFPAFLFAFAGLGLFASPRSWERPRAALHLLALLGLLPSFLYVLFFINERYLSTLMPFLCIWCAGGFLVFEAWAGSAIKAARSRAVVKKIPAAILGLLLFMNGTLLISAYRNQKLEHKAAGLWLREHIREPYHLCADPRITYYAGLAAQGGSCLSIKSCAPLDKPLYIAASRIKGDVDMQARSPLWASFMTEDPPPLWEHAATVEARGERVYIHRCLGGAEEPLEDSTP
jgi:4-amino-4-deoxy-L-arabinose transferase-like glycosyltransferase